jgi:predicted permease
LHVISQVSILFILIVLGYICARVKVTGPEASAWFSPFILNITLPCMLLVSFQRPFSRELLGELGAAVLASVILYSIAFPLAYIYPHILRMKGPERGVHRYAILFSNCGFIGYPMIEAVLGPDYIFHACIFNMLFSLFAYSVGAWIIAREGESTRHLKLSWKTFLNPSIIAIFAGFLMFLFSVSLPAPLFKSLKMLGDVTSPLSMIVIGVNLAQAKTGRLWSRWRLYVTSFIRLVVMPFLVGLGCRLLGIQGPLLILAVVLTAMPAGSTTSIMASVYNVAPEDGSALVFLSTLFSMATIPLAMIVSASLGL